MYEIFSCSELGEGHSVNEDSFIVQAHPSEPTCLLVAFADGQGGQPGGARAALVACTSVIEEAKRTKVTALIGWQTWPAILRAADETVSGAPEAGFTTLIGLCCISGQLSGASNGDSAAVVVNASGEWIEITNGQPKNPPIGSGVAACRPFLAKLVDPWKLMVMSDGVWKYAGWDQIKKAATEFRGQAFLEVVQAAARLPSTGRFQDDFTLILIQREN